MLRLVTPIVAKELIFSENFIQYQLSLIQAASQLVVETSLLEEKKINTIINYMKDLRADTSSFAIAGSKRDRSYQGLKILIEDTLNKLTSQYKWSGKQQPLMPVLKQLQINIENYIRVAQPQFYSQTLTEKSIAAKKDAEELDDPIKAGTCKEPVFSENFMQLQASIIKTASQTIMKDGLLEEKSMRSFFEYMRDLQVTTKDIKMTGVKDANRNYLSLLSCVEELADDLKTNYRLSNVDPLIAALKTIKKNIQEYILHTQPQFTERLRQEQKEILATMTSLRWDMVKNACGILACLIWCLPEKIITVDNGCETMCGSSHAICPGPSLPKQTKHGVQYWSLWSPGESMAVLCQGMGSAAVEIEGLEAEPIRQTMS